MMTRRPWYKRYPADFFNGCVSLTFEEKGAYALVLDLIYHHGGPIPDNDRYISGMLSLSVRGWRNLRDRLIVKGKLSLEGGVLANRRASVEMDLADKISRERQEAGAAGGHAKASNGKLSANDQEIISELSADNNAISQPKPLKNNDPPLAIASSPRGGASESETERKKLIVSSSRELETRPNGIRKRREYPEDFERFWKDYPTDSNMSKAEALQAWQRLAADDRALAIESLPGFRKFCAADATYRPIHANRYLSKRRFEGHAETAREAVTTVCEITAEMPNWQAWRTYLRDTGKNFSVKTMDELASEKKAFPVPTQWPPGHHGAAA